MSFLSSLLYSFRWPALLIGLFALVVAGGFYLVAPELAPYVRVLLPLGLVLLLVSAVGFAEEIGVFLGGRGARYGTNTTVMIVAFLGIAFLLNFMATRGFQRFDLTKTQQFTLSPQTVKVLQGLKQPVKAYGFFSSEAFGEQEARDLLTEYGIRSDRFSVEFLDPTKRPELANKYNVRSDGTVTFVSGDKSQNVTRIAEQDFTSAILKVTRGLQKKVYFLTGHGERELADFRDRGYGQAGQALRDDSYLVESLNLVVSTTVPSDAAVLVIPNPEKTLLEEEKKAIADYLEAGGKALVLVEPTASAGLEAILGRWGVIIGKGTVVDPAGSLLGSIATPVVEWPRYGSTQITNDLPMSFFPTAAMITSTFEFGQVITATQKPDEALILTPLAQTTDKGWLETDPMRAQFDPASDLPGPIPMALMVEKTLPPGVVDPQREKERKTRLVVFGDADFASNQWFNQVAHADLFLNSVNWLAEEEELISIRPKRADIRRVFLGRTDANLILVSSAVVLPALVLLGGGFVWWRRR